MIAIMTPKATVCLGFAFALLACSANANGPVRICLSAGNEAEGVTAMIHHVDDSSVRIDSPYSDNPNSRITRWTEIGYFDRFWSAVQPTFSELDEDALASCDDGWRDTLVVTFADGVVVRRDASCQRNPIFLLRNELAMNLSSFVDNASREDIVGAAEGVHDPCAKEW